MEHIRVAVATVFGLGFLRPAPGTWGSLPPPLLLAGMWAGGAGPRSMNIAMVAAIIIFSASTVLLGPWAETRFGKKDPRQVVADETAGQAVALLAAPWAWIGEFGAAGSVMRFGAYAGAAFVLFRLFDITKPPPAGGLQRLPHGWGILVDDLLAGFYALVILQLVWRFLI